MKTNAAEILHSNVTDVCNENESLTEQVNFLLHALTKAQTRAEVAESRLEKIEKMTAWDLINVGNQFKKMRIDSHYNVERSWHSTRINLELVVKLHLLRSSLFLYSFTAALSHVKCWVMLFSENKNF